VILGILYGQMLYIGPWLEYKLAKQLEERESLRPEASRLPSIGRSTAERNTLPQIATRRSATSEVTRPDHTGGTGPLLNDCVRRSNPAVSAPHAHQRRDFYGEARSMRRFQNELASLGSPSKAVRRPLKPSSCTSGPSPFRGVPASTNKRLVQIQRMQTIYRQGKEKAQAQTKDNPRQNVVLPSIYQDKKTSPLQSFSRQLRTKAATDDDDDEDDDILAWANGLDLGSI